MNILAKIGKEKKVYFLLASAIASLVPCWFFYDSINDDILFIYLSIFCIVLVPLHIFLLRNIRCPQCDHRLIWEYLNNSNEFPKGYSPFTSEYCPKCNNIMSK
jgi:hypothetical protein